jgi:hypothetical protein
LNHIPKLRGTIYNAFKNQFLMKSTLLTMGTIALLSVTTYAQTNVAPFKSKVPMAFVENKGQITDQTGNTRTDIDFRLSSGNVNVFISQGQIHYQWSQAQPSYAASLTPRSVTNTAIPIDIYRMDMELLGANLNGEPERYDKSDYYENYYLSQTGPEGSRAMSYQKLVYKEVYPNIDWVLYIKAGKLEHDFVLHPGANVSQIKMKFSGATNISVNDDGSLTAVTPFGSISEAAPYSYQEDGKAVASAYVLSDNIVGFTTADYSGKLTIDPTVSWSTYIGGNGLAEEVYGLHVVGTDLYVGGMTNSAANIATTGAHQTTYGGFADGMLMKFNSAGTLLWATYYGGDETDAVAVIDHDSLGYIYIAGHTYSATGIATPGSHQTVYGGSTDLLFAKFDSSGARIFGSYYGGSGSDANLPDIEISGGYFYVSGSTNSNSGIASAGAPQPALAGNSDLFVAKFNLNGVRQWGTYVGGSGTDNGGALAVDRQDNIYLFGRTNSESGLATPGAHKAVFNFVNGNYDHCLVKLNANGVKQWATYHGGDEDETPYMMGYNIACDDAGNVYFTGSTKSTSGISTSGTHQPFLGGGEDCYLAKFDSTGTKLWGTYYGGDGNEIFTTISIADTNTVYLVGMTTSTSGMASANALNPTFSGGVYYGDAFVAKFDGMGNRQYGSYFGSTGTDGAMVSCADNVGNLYMGGITNSPTNISTPGSHQSAYPGALAWGAFLVKFCFAPPASYIQVQGPDSVCRNSVVTYSIPPVPEASQYIWTLPSGWSGASNTNSIDVTTTGQGGVLSVQVVRCSDSSVISSLPVFVHPADIPVIIEDNSVLSTAGNYVSYQWLLNDTEIPGGTASTLTVAEVGDYRVITTNAQGCTDTSEVYTVTQLSVKLHSLYNQVAVFPNPTSDLINIQSPVAVHITLTDIYGKTVQQWSKVPQLSTSHLANGMYFLQIADNNGELIKTVKIVKQ